MINNVLLSVFGVYLLCYLILAALTKRFLKTIIITAVIGISALLILKFSGVYLGISVPINVYTLWLCGFTGLPGVILLLILNIIFI